MNSINLNPYPNFELVHSRRVELRVRVYQTRPQTVEDKVHKTQLVLKKHQLSYSTMCALPIASPNLILNHSRTSLLSAALFRNSSEQFSPFLGGRGLPLRIPPCG